MKLTTRQLQAASIDEERHRDEDRRHARRDPHALTDYPCRLPDGSIGRTAVILRDGGWTLVCRIA